MSKHSPEEVAPTIAKIEEIWGRMPNQESSQPPLYHALAAAWFHLGEWTSRERPHFFQGRLMLGALTPFATLYVYGLDRLLRGVPGFVMVAVGAIAITITISDVLANRVAFTSAYNCFHM
jgi:hypothetical protein